VLDYALTGVARIDAVDANPRQTALLELKLAAIRRLGFDDFFMLFGTGHHAHFSAIYRDALRAELAPASQRFWDAHTHWFTDRKRSFYYRGLSGLVARAFRAYLTSRPGLHDHVEALFAARSVDEQRMLYDERIRGLLWSRPVNWALSRQVTMSLLGVPHPQRKEVQAQHHGGIAGFVRDSVEYVFRHLPAGNNYFWSLYLRGRYGTHNCPEYLRRGNFHALKAGLADRIVPHTCTVTGFLRSTPRRFSRFVLLDHMDWMSSYQPRALAEEWDEILAHAAPQARVIFRSAHRAPRYLDAIEIGASGRRLREVFAFDAPLAARLHREDRVGTYAGFHIAELQATA
jgi:S-adenosylmethionine-diacylglycerol 3-amino-3-carboxypropyl transferase